MSVYKHYLITDYDAYFEDVQPQIEELLREYLPDDSDEHFGIAIDEVVCNAVRYAAKPEQLKITLTVMINCEDMVVSVASETEKWDVMSFKKRLEFLAANSEIQTKEWGEYVTDEKVGGRGFWLILMACEYVFVDIDTHKVTLVCRRPYTENQVTKEIQALIPRLLLEREGVVLRYAIS